MVSKNMQECLDQIERIHTSLGQLIAERDDLIRERDELATDLIRERDEPATGTELNYFHHQLRQLAGPGCSFSAQLELSTNGDGESRAEWGGYIGGRIKEWKYGETPEDVLEGFRRVSDL